MAHDRRQFCGRCRSRIWPHMATCPNCGAWRESATSGDPVTGQ